jgi:hypothetical protein
LKSTSWSATTAAVRPLLGSLPYLAIFTRASSMRLV